MLMVKDRPHNPAYRLTSWNFLATRFLPSMMSHCALLSLGVGREILEENSPVLVLEDIYRKSTVDKR
jgi:hypothetical protein